MPTQNLRVKSLIASIEGAGFPVRELWASPQITWPGDNFGRARQYVVDDNTETRRPAAVRSFLVVELDGNTYSLFAEHRSIKIANDVELICGQPEGTAADTFAIIYDHGPENAEVEEYYGFFGSVGEAKTLWDSLRHGRNDYRNAKLCKIVEQLPC